MGPHSILVTLPYLNTGATDVLCFAVMMSCLKVREHVRMRRNVWWRVVLAAVAMVYVVWTLSADSSDDDQTPSAPSFSHTTSAAPDALSGLPAQVGETLALIDVGGPYPYSRDDTVFMNREGQLPQQPRGYWREFTVPTPKSPDRGARRIVRGKAGETYYTDDHYQTFTRIDRSSQ